MTRRRRQKQTPALVIPQPPPEIQHGILPRYYAPQTTCPACKTEHAPVIKQQAFHTQHQLEKARRCDECGKHWWEVREMGSR